MHRVRLFSSLYIGGGKMVFDIELDQVCCLSLKILNSLHTLSFFSIYLFFRVGLRRPTVDNLYF